MTYNYLLRCEVAKEGLLSLQK